jgi:hypothetical protein
VRPARIDTRKQTVDGDYVEFQPFFSQSFFHPLSISESLVENADQHFSPVFSSAALTTQTSLW